MPRFDARLLRGSRVRAPVGHRIVATRLAGGDAATVVCLRGEGDLASRRLVSAAVADLLSACASPTRLPRHAIGTRQLAGLILDGLLEIELAGRFRTGAAAHHALFTGDRPPPRGPLARLSVGALHTAAARGPASPARIADRLYRFNTRPASASWQRLLPTDAAVRRFVGVEDGRGSDQGEATGVWHAWHAVARSPAGPNRPTWKLYVSPVPEATGDACRALREAMRWRHGPFSMKVGRTLNGVLRPDRLVAYFAEPAALRHTAARLRQTLRGTPAQGVPFTASLGGNGLLSWGADFQSGDALPDLAMERSWRGWITVRLGSALATALQSGARHPVAFALDRVWLDGVRTGTWTPDWRALDRPDHADP